MCPGKEEQEIKEEETFHAHTSLLNQMEIIVVPIGRRSGSDRVDGASGPGKTTERSSPLCCVAHTRHSTALRASSDSDRAGALIKVLMHPRDRDLASSYRLHLLLLLPLISLL